MRTCKCKHWEVCPTCQPDWFDIDGNRLPPEPTPLQKANGRIEELEQQLAEANDRSFCSTEAHTLTMGKLAELRQQLAAAQAEAMTFEEWYGTEDFEYDSELASAAWTKGAASRDAEVAELRDQLNTFHSAVEHVTEDGCTRRSFVAMPEGWAMVHKDRLHDLELAEEQLADVRNQVLDECAAIAEDTAAGRDAEAIADAIRVMKYKSG